MHHVVIIILLLVAIIILIRYFMKTATNKSSCSTCSKTGDLPEEKKDKNRVASEPGISMDIKDDEDDKPED